MAQALSVAQSSYQGPLPMTMPPCRVTGVELPTLVGMRVVSL